MAKRLDVLVIDEQPIIRWALEHLFKSQEGIRILGEADSIDQAAVLARAHRPDVVIMDVTHSNSLNSASVMEFVRAQHWHALGFSAHDTWDHVSWFLQSGGLGFVSKRSPLGELLPALYAVAHGRQWVSPSLRSAEAMGATVERVDSLSRREYEVAALIAKGLTSKQIADQLCVSLKTVEAHRYRVFRKLRIRRSAQLVEYVLRGSLANKEFGGN